MAEPKALALDATGALYVADAKESNVKVFATAQNGASPARTIGEPGGHRPGAWNPNRMNAPASMAIEERADGKRQLWCVEGNNHPRRVSIWDESGKLIRDYLGNTNYSGHGGLMSDNEPRRGVFAASGAGLIFDVDYPNYDYKLVEIMGGSPDPQPGKISLFHIGFAGQAASADFGSGYLFKSKASGKDVEYFLRGPRRVHGLHEARRSLAVRVGSGKRWHDAAMARRVAAAPFAACRFLLERSQQRRLSAGRRNQIV